MQYIQSGHGWLGTTEHRDCAIDSNEIIGNYLVWDKTRTYAEKSLFLSLINYTFNVWDRHLKTQCVDFLELPNESEVKSFQNLTNKSDASNASEERSADIIHLTVSDISYNTMLLLNVYMSATFFSEEANDVKPAVESDDMHVHKIS